MRDCFFLVADKNMEFVLRGLFRRAGFHRSIGCSRFTFDVAEDCLIAAYRDPDVKKKSAEYTRTKQLTHSNLVVMLDSAWDGSPGAEVIREQVANDLRSSGWHENRFAVIVFDPELEIWMWQESPHVHDALAFDPDRFGAPSLRDWLADRHLWLPGEKKPHDPKKAFTTALAQASRPRSSTIYEKIASRVSLKECTDPAFQTLCDALRRWFPA